MKMKLLQFLTQTPTPTIIKILDLSLQNKMVQNKISTTIMKVTLQAKV